MYKKTSPQLTIDDFILPFSGKLSADNRWVKLAGIIPWDELEKQYAFMFPSDRGNVAKPVRMALGSLLIQARCDYSDRETVQQITENPYLQYFIGLKEYQLTKPFTPVALVKFRKRFNAKRMAEINELILQAEKAQKKTQKDQDDDHDDRDANGSGGGGPAREGYAVVIEEPASTQNSESNQGTLILDATCTPADIKYPTDLGLLNEARENLDIMIDCLHEGIGKPTRRPRTHREKARKDYLTLSKQRSPRKHQIRKAVKKQLQYVKRNLGFVDQLLQKAKEQNVENVLRPRQVTLLGAIRELYAQQSAMYKNRTHRIQDRIVSLHQPHVRPIVRGKAKASVEFGAKVAISLDNGYSRIEKLSWDSYNEAETLRGAVERYKERHGHYPEAVLADRIYRNRENLAFCKQRGIRLSGPRLGRPLANGLLKKAEKRMERLDARQRNAVEGKFGEGKRKYGLACIMARLKETAECMISMQFLVMNLEHKLRVLFVQFWLRMMAGTFKPSFC
ncbi:IS5 family transposase [Heliobacterium undosum]|uniref:IS5 family transposase n=1 Tax=Heliomicrobium undosum TaxID=121734 RepID=A0A845LEY4_9FIRM|nr:IS5 family transposase [Heliomicrobium undosum]MZP31491.1 IS5 family transposase [Heliomicrobium undosum]